MRACLEKYQGRRKMRVACFVVSESKSACPGFSRNLVAPNGLSSQTECTNNLYGCGYKVPMQRLHSDEEDRGNKCRRVMGAARGKQMSQR
jgi:hypothetical protein